MRILERVGIFQPIAEDSVEAGVSEQDCPGEYQPRDGDEESQHIKHHRKPLVMNEVIGPRANPWVRQIAKYAQVGS